MKTWAASFAWTAATALVIGACSSSPRGGGGATIPPEAGPTDAAADAASDASGTGCPVAPPSTGSACGPQGLVCETGAASTTECDTLATCNGGRWEVVTPMPGDPVCASGSASQCPASLATVPIGQHCTPLGLDCDYPQGRCSCTVRTGAPGLDASADASWICPSPGPGCPLPRARLGSTCTREGLECDYGACAIPGITGGQACTGGVWVPTSAKCGG